MKSITGMAERLASLTRQELAPKPTTNKNEGAYHLTVESSDVCLSEIEGEVIKGMLSLYLQIESQACLTLPERPLSFTFSQLSANFSA